MRLGITLGRRKGSKHFQVLIGPEVPLPEQIAGFKKLQLNPAAAEQFEEIELWNAGQGRAKRVRFRESGSGINPDAINPPAETPPSDETATSSTDESAPESSPAAPGDFEPSDDAPAAEAAEPAGMESVLPSKKTKTK